MKKTATLLFGVIMLLCAARGKAAVVYSDLQPDSTMMLSTSIGSGSGINLDFNHDGTVDFYFRWDDWGSEWFCHIVPDYLNHAKVMITGINNPYGAGYVKLLNAGDLLQIRAADGSRVFETVISSTEWSGDVTLLSPGLYFISMMNRDGELRISRKLVVE